MGRSLVTTGRVATLGPLAISEMTPPPQNKTKKTVIGVEAAILQSLNHGFVSSAPFLTIKVLYDCTLVVSKIMGALTHTMPTFIIIIIFYNG